MKDLAARRAELEGRLAVLDARLRALDAELDSHQSKDWEELATEREGDEVLEKLGQSGEAEIARIRAAGLDPEAHLARHDSLPALRAGGALLVTGETGTNVADFQILVRGAG